MANLRASGVFVGMLSTLFCLEPSPAPDILGRFRKHNATQNRDVTCLGMAWTRLPVSREVASAWRSQRKELFSDVVRAAPCFLGRHFLSNIASGSMFGSALLGQWWRITSRFDVALCFLNLPIVCKSSAWYVTRVAPATRWNPSDICQYIQSSTP